MTNDIKNSLGLGPQITFDLSSLPAFLRVLLTTDGTVTKSLQAFFWEPIIVETTRQSTLTLEEAVPDLECVAGDNVLERHVQLRGTESGKIYVKADSLIRLELLPETIRRSLRAQNIGVGELLRDCGLETYREILSMNFDENSNHLARIYRIIMSHKPFIQITERFPVSVYR